MKKRFLSTFLVLCIVFSTLPVLTFSASVSIQGPTTLVTPMDGSYSMVKYSLVDETGSEITQGVEWSVDDGLVIMSDGSVILHHSDENEYNSNPGKYTLKAVYSGTASTLVVNVRDGLYSGEVLEGKQTITYAEYQNGLKSDFTIEFKIKATKKETRYISGFSVNDGVNNDFFLLYLNNAQNDEFYKFYFRDYTGTGGNDYGTTETIETDVPHGEWISLKYVAKKDSEPDANVKFDTYYASVDSDGNVGTYKLMCADVNPRYTTYYKGFYAFRIQNLTYISLDDFNVYTGELFDIESDDYKYNGLKLIGKSADDSTDSYLLPRKAQDITQQYKLVNFINTSLSDEASWSVSPEGKGVSVSDSGLLTISADTDAGDYILTASVGGHDVTRQISISADEYKLMLAGSDGYVFDHTFDCKKFYFGASDQNNTSASVIWSVVNPAAGISISKTDSGLGELTVTSDAVEGTYTIKAVADSDEGFDVDTATLDFTLSKAGYSLVGEETVSAPQSGYNAFDYNLVSDLGNAVTTGLKWSCDKGEILNDGRLIISKLTPSELKITAEFNDKIYNKNISLNDKGAVGIPYDRTLTYKGTTNMSVSSGKSEKTLYATATEDGKLNPTAKIIWKLTKLSDELLDYNDDIYVTGSKLIVNGALCGTVYIEGTVENTLASTGEIAIVLNEAFSSLSDDILTVKGTSGEAVTISCHKPVGSNYIALSLDYSPVAEIMNFTVGSDGQVKCELPMNTYGIYYITAKKGTYTDEYTVCVGTDKLFSQSDVKTLLSDSRIKEYHLMYSNASADVIEKSSDLYSAFTSQQKDDVLKLTDNDYNKYFVAALTVQLLCGDSSNIELLKNELEKLEFDTDWVDLLVNDANMDEVCKLISDELKCLQSVNSLATEKIILTGIANCSTTNTKEAKPYLSLAGSSVYNNASDKNKNRIAAALAGKEYDTIPKLIEAIESVSLTSSNNSGSGASSGGGRVQSGTVGSVSSVITPSIPEVSTEIFSDLPKEHWAYDYIRLLVDKNIVNGYSGNYFLPENKVSRAEFVKMLVEAFNIKKSADVPFEDVPAEAWYVQYLSGAYEAGLVLGDGKCFYPDDSITRQDASVMIYRFAKYAGVNFANSEILFTDTNSIADYAIEAVNALSSSGIINGLPDGSFAPMSDATRAEASKLICIAMEKGGIE